MGTLKAKYLKWLTKKPYYYRARAVEMGEQYGCWIAEWKVVKYKLNNNPSAKKAALKFCNKMAGRYLYRMEWYAFHGADLIETPDYQS